MRSCVNCKYAGRPTYKSPCSECKGYSKHEAVEIRTNADRIRAMSDEELADAWIRDNTICDRCAYREECECDDFVTDEKCREGILEWHKQPVEDLGTFQAECRGPLL